MTLHRTARAIGVLALAAPIALALSPSAFAASTDFSNPSSDGQTVTDTTIAANVPGCTPTLTNSCSTTTLTLSGPNSTSVKGTAATSRSTYSVSADISKTTANGTWTATLSGGDTGSRTFYTNFAPASPTGVNASSTDGDAHDVTVQWNKGSEPDLLGYRITDQDGNVTPVKVADACAGSTCTNAFYYDNPTPGTYAYSYTLVAVRSGGCSSSPCANVSSDPSSSASTTLTTAKAGTAPTATPSAGSSPGTTTGGSTTGGGTTGGTTSGTTGGSTSGTTGGSTTGTSTGATAVSPAPTPTVPTLDNVAASRRALALNFSAFAPSLGLPKIPPLPDTSELDASPTLAGADGATPTGSYQAQLPYADQTTVTKKTSFIADPVSAVTSISLQDLAKPLAMALILMLAAAHLRRWIGSHIED